MQWRDRLFLFLILLGPAVALAIGWYVQAPALAGQTQGATERPFQLVARRYSFAPVRIEVFEGDLVKVDLSTADIAHSFTIDDYRISKRVEAGHPISFEFRAEHVGTFPFYCNLQADDGCKNMKGELIVSKRP
jgi:heme/copper-type cytochrome/quinol oxidase subunit 2